MPIDNRKPNLKKIGCYFMQANDSGFHFFSKERVKDGDVFVYNKGILWKIEV